MPLSDVKKIELPSNIQKRIYIYERSSALNLLENLPIVNFKKTFFIHYCSPFNKSTILEAIFFQEFSLASFKANSL